MRYPNPHALRIISGIRERDVPTVALCRFHGELLILQEPLNL